MMCRGQRSGTGSWGAEVKEVAGTEEGIAFSLPLQASRAAGTHMFWCMRQPSAPARLPPHGLRRTDTLRSLLPVLVQIHSDTAASTLQSGAPALSEG